MNLNLGLEALNTGNSVVYRNTENNSNLFIACDSVLGQLTTSLENMFDAAKNAVAIRSALRKYGKTQSIVALVGNEGLAAAQSFSMEGFWQKAKEMLVAIWNKICEWWNRFWSIFFSNQKKMEELAKAKGSLVRTVEYDGVNIDGFRKALEEVKNSVNDIKKKVETLTVMKAGSYYNAADANHSTDPVTGKRDYYQLDGNNPASATRLDKDITKSSSTTGENNATRGSQLGLSFIHIKLEDGNKVKERAKELAFILKECGKLQTAIDKASKQALKAAQKISDSNNSQQTISDSKACASRMRNTVQQYFKAANTEAAKLAAHASFSK